MRTLPTGGDGRSLPRDSMPVKRGGDRDVPAVTAPADSTSAQAVAPADSAAVAPVDSAVLRQERPGMGVMLEPPAPRPAAMRTEYNLTDSVVTGVLLGLFCLVALKYRNNFRYVSALVRDTVEVRERENIFDDTVRETSFMTLLNLLEMASGGVLLAYGVSGGESPGLPAIGICALLCGVYSLFMWGACAAVGNIFADRQHTRMWVRASASANGLLGIPLLVLALLCLCYPMWVGTCLAVAAGCFVVAKLSFIWKGFRIFFAQMGSWVLFLYYLCSLEIVPLIILVAVAFWICGHPGLAPF